jgi:tape measure domain-containing protein
VVRELGEEFGFAAKQVLLFGTAYKALAFLQSFPGQVGDAVGALQSFRNTLKTVTPSAAEFDKSSKFILSLVDQYNVPLQAARDGFAKLYASMKPAGFSGAEIRGLFEGVSMGAATFGMSADKVDRVMYAFAQMASKGQVMSEELKGQLGDVLPGALSLFAKAADMSVQEFGQAMEDGAFKGEAMRQLLINVGATMKEEFGKGAVGAAVTYQGVMNRLQTTTVLFYVAFEPAAVAFANTFILPITNGIRIVTDAFTQLLTGQQALTQGGSELAANMQPLIPIFQGIGDNLKQVATAAFNTVKALLPVVQFLLQLAASPVVGFLAQMYASLLLLNGAFTLLARRLLIGVIASLAQTAIRMTALNAATVITNSSLAGTQLQLRMLSAGFAQTGAAATGFAMTIRTAMMTTVVGAIVAAVAIGIAEFMRLRGVMASIEGRYKSLGD